MGVRSEEHTSELQSLRHLVCRLLLEKKKKTSKAQRDTSCIFEQPRVLRPAHLWNQVVSGPRVVPFRARCVSFSLTFFFFFFNDTAPTEIYTLSLHDALPICNLSTGADLSSGASPVKDIYDGGFHMTAPPNSPWAAIDGDFGLEISGYLSHIAHLPPGDVFPFRFYTHDPWWLNSPWFDRYGREPHDIYLPLALARLDAQGKVTPPAFLEFLTIDNSYGEMPDECPNEVTPHILSAMDHFSDAPGVLTWVYPFEEFHEKVFGNAPRPSEVFFSDWFMRNAVNAGLPLNTVVSTTNFLVSQKTSPATYRDTVLLTPVPDSGSPLESALLQHLDAGGDVFLYGPATHASPKLLDLLHVNIASPLSGELEVRSVLAGDAFRHGAAATRMLNRDAPSGGGIDTAAAQPAAAGQEICATVSDGSNERV